MPDLAITPPLERILVEALYPFHFLTAKQISQLLYPGTVHKGAQVHLKRLVEAKYVDCFPLPTGYNLKPYIYLLGEHGKKYLRDIRNYEVVKLPKLSVMEKRSNTFPHAPPLRQTTSLLPPS